MFRSNTAVTPVGEYAVWVMGTNLGVLANGI